MSVANAASGAVGLLGKAGGFLSGASNLLGPVSTGLKVGSMLYGAWNATKLANKQKKELAKKAGKIQDQIVNQASMVRDELQDIDEEYQKQQAGIGEEIGDTLNDASKGIGQVIQRGRGLLTGDAEIKKQNIMDKTGEFVDNKYEVLNTNRGREYSGILDTHHSALQSNEQGLLDIAKQRKELEKRDSFWENLIG